ncbi:MAG: PH domain-containing protein [Promethearchaeota archaeon]
MSKEKKAFEGTISMSYRNKQLIKFGILWYLIAIVSILSTIWPTYAIFEAEGIPIGFELAIIIIASFMGTATLIVMLGYWYNHSYVKNFSYKISEDHIIINHGVFTKTRATIPYSRVQNINIVNGVFDRMFKTFTVKIETAGSSAAAAGAQGGHIRPEGYIPGLKEPHIIEMKIKEMMTKYSAVPSGLEDKIFKPEELAFDNFISYILSKMREGEKLKTSIKELREKANLSVAQLAEKVGVPIQTINYLEEGRYNPSLALAYKISEVLKCKIEDLFKLA